MVQVEVNSFSPPSLSPLLTAAQVKWCGWEQQMDHRGLHLAVADIVLLLPYHTNQLHVSSIFFKPRSSDLGEQTVPY